MAITFENEKILFDDKYGTAKEIDCFLPVHLTIGGKENDLYKKDGSHNEQYYKWQFLYCFVSAGLCSKDFIGVEVSFPKVIRIPPLSSLMLRFLIIKIGLNIIVHYTPKKMTQSGMNLIG